MGFLAAAAPILLQVMEDCLSLVILACIFIVVFVEIVLSAALVDASELTLFCHELLLLLFRFASFF